MPSRAHLSFALAAVVGAGLLGAPSASAAEDPSYAPASACQREFVPASSFGDIAGSTHGLSIDCLQWYGVANGKTPGSYAPTEAVRRDQMASFLVRALAELRVALPAGEDRFTDLEGNPHRENVERLAAAGIVKGTGDGLYGPAQAVTRGQMATMLLGALDRFLPPVGRTRADWFSDDDGTTHEANIDQAHYVRLVQGIVPPQNTGDSEFPSIKRGIFRPQDAVRRDQMATFVGRVVDKGVLHALGGLGNPYPAGTGVLLRDGWELTLLGADDHANAEVEAHEPGDQVPDDKTLMVYRVRATYRGDGSSRFGGEQRLQSGTIIDVRGHGVPPHPFDPGYSAAGRPCGTIPYELPDPEASRGETIEGNLCFAYPGGSQPDAENAPPSLKDAAWGKPTRPHFGGSYVRAEPQPGEEQAPYAPPKS